ncbi:2-amino-4-hydroxy-6-hydroxymethyldihydropteridine diphosphokinase [Pseudorhodoferax soli]|uniref:2-amino-4-hydroxy-6-hydroxymethyldihydropteridine pyrophosphokinase n=1 Tax=Pseudorhodoferax soli TaxID=545864 RepID=A0A368Y6Z1_9BURK|nr:2-amino-4-hydroxy-6-hydroxymethyldihydropteridine diphosphokinase [Pseudorhodoferax soli]RCW76050.1 2-amino-4-hydroxy-6-hydroxymethyldihydropteridine diphosphokinase [Pseudorhodoferax soli]
MAAASAFVGLGGNLGDARAAVLWALAALDRLPGTRLVCSSSLYRSAPVEAGGPDYVNAVAKLATHLSPLDLLDGLQALELQAGRERPYVNAPRTLDLDVLLYADRALDLPRLKIPHPRMWQRAFVLQPLAEIEPGLVPASALESVSGQQITRCEQQGSAG